MALPQPHGAQMTEAQGTTQASTEAVAPPKVKLGAWARDSGHAVLDETNEKILRLLSQHGRSTMRDIADSVGRTESTVRDRVSTLELRGIVRGYEARIDWALAGLPVVVMFEAYCPPERFTEVAERLHKIPNVMQAILTTGTRNVLAIVRARDSADVRKLLVQMSATSLESIQTRMALEHLVEERQSSLLLKSTTRETSGEPFPASSIRASGLGDHAATVLQGEPAHASA